MASDWVPEATLAPPVVFELESAGSRRRRCCCPVVFESSASAPDPDVVDTVGVVEAGHCHRSRCYLLRPAFQNSAKAPVAVLNWPPAEVRHDRVAEADVVESDSASSRRRSRGRRRRCCGCRSRRCRYWRGPSSRRTRATAVKADHGGGEWTAETGLGSHADLLRSRGRAKPFPGRLSARRPTAGSRPWVVTGRAYPRPAASKTFAPALVSLPSPVPEAARPGAAGARRSPRAMSSRQARRRWPSRAAPGR